MKTHPDAYHLQIGSIRGFAIALLRCALTWRAVEATIAICSRKRLTARLATAISPWWSTNCYRKLPGWVTSERFDSISSCQQSDYRSVLTVLSSF